MAHSVFTRAVITATAMLVANSVMAGFSVEVRVDNILIDTIFDNVVPDLNPAVGDIQYHFVLQDQNNIWRAEGDVFAEGGFNGQPPVSTVVTNTLIEKIADVPIIAGEIDFTHNYAASGLQVHTADIDGQFDNQIDHNVQGASLEYYADINGQSLGSFVTGIYVGLGPAPFADTLGPLPLPTTTEHHMKLRFYLDSLGDSIELFNSAEIHTNVPEPSALALATILFLSFNVRRQRYG